MDNAQAPVPDMWLVRTINPDIRNAQICTFHAFRVQALLRWRHVMLNCIAIALALVEPRLRHIGSNYLQKQNP